METGGGELESLQSRWYRYAAMSAVGILGSSRGALYF